ncbi:CPBP family intramembrane glutamic endopeptidase [Sporomusa sp.]|uniref:CPBP family intramembrane glutamic endopeptidase n=1 Tax=Sporomusa sp. TaxID=2078658 RepID=UPI002B632B9D|nr:CPBP family intramembrane glutamic endopeptidase [Sporomusa sp.]HWR41858.1 CPBP family intramembrane glutamic endopeptidase [Sporomusa sp.]
MRIISVECIVMYIWVFLIVWVNVQTTISGSFIIGITLPMLLYIHYVDRKNLSEYLQIRMDRCLCGISWGLGFSLLFAGVSLSKAMIIGHGKLWFTWPVDYWLNSVIAASTVEELFFRGFLLNKLIERINLFSANVVVSIMFVVIHIPVWLADGILGWNMLGNAMYIGTLSGLFGYLYCRTQSLWTPIILHAANNYLTLVTIGVVYQ